MKNYFLTFIILYSLIFTAACPARTDIDKAVSASKKMTRITTFAAGEVGVLYKGEIITLDMKTWVDAKLRIVADGNARFYKLLEAIRDAQGGNIKTLTAEQKSALDVFFNAEVIRHFTEILDAAGLLSPEIAKKILVAVSAVKAAILAISIIFDRGSVSYKFYMREIGKV